MHNALSPQDLRDLLEKYDSLLTLHAGEPGRTLDRRDALRAVAVRFPGALREWEELPLAELMRRRQRIAELLAVTEAEGSQAASALAEHEPWLRYGLELHACLRALLSQCRSLAKQPGRRLSELAYEEVAARHGVTAADVKHVLFSSPPADLR